MKHRIAIATSDGLTIHRHFGKARQFQIVDTDGETYVQGEIRSVEPPCAEGGHSAAAFDAVLDILHDCEAVAVGMIGPGAADYLTEKGMRVFAGAGVVENVMRNILSRKLLD
jgi:predicted Fe-Mo cluster-binding NifX family protein